MELTIQLATDTALCPRGQAQDQELAQRPEDKGHARRQARRARRRRRSATAARTPPATPDPHPATPVSQTNPLPARRRTAVAPSPSFAAARLAGRLGGALRRGVPPGPTPRRHPLPCRPPGLRKRHPRCRPPPLARPGAAPPRRVLPHRRPAPPVLGRQGAASQVQGHREHGEDGDFAACPCSVHRAERGAVQSGGAQQPGGVHPVRRRRARVAVPRRLLAGLRRRLPRRHRLPTRRDSIDQIARVLELSQRRRPPARRGACELDDDVLLRLHTVPGEPGAVARFTAGSGRRRRRWGRRRGSSAVTSRISTLKKKKKHCS